MTAFLIYIVTIVGTAGITRDLTVMFPMPTMETCAAYLNDPSQFENDFDKTFTTRPARYTCIPRNPERKNGEDPPEKGV
jgi:hypothetical protein